jgi:hypothetical protein
MDDEIKKLLETFDNGARFSSFTEYDLKPEREGRLYKRIVALDKNDENRVDMLPGLLNRLPDLYKDSDNHTEIILGLCYLVLQMENKINYLYSYITTGKTAVEISKDLQEHFLKMAKDTNMSSHEGVEITFDVKSSMFSENNESSSKDSKHEKMNNSFSNFSGELGGLLKIIADLKISGNMQERIKTIENELNASAKHEIEAQSMSGKGTIKFGEMKCDPSLPLIEKMLEDKDKRLTPEFVEKLKKNPHNEK